LIMPSKSLSQHRLMSAVAHNPDFAEKVGIPTRVGKDFAAADKGKKFKEGGGVSLAVGRGEKLSVDQGAGLTAKGRAKYNRETGSHLKAPQPQGGGRKDSFCARMSGVVEHSKGDAPRAKASLKRWKCPG
jgi:Domain of unknown function (DUF6321)